MMLGAQFYTLRDYTTNLNDFAETLAKVADIGYRTVQISCTCAFEGGWLAEQLRKNSLRCVLTHADPVKMREDPLSVAETHRRFGCEYIGLGYPPGGIPDEAAYERLRDDFLPVANSFAENGALLMYHNHNLEFARDSQNRRFIDRLTEDFTPEQMGFTLDTYWVQAAGGDPIDWIRRLKGRVPCVHLKDMAWDGGIKMAPIYEGNMNFDGILAACGDAGTEYLLVEQDDCYGEDPFACLRRSYENLKAKGLT
ncbi:MAG: sugar phosphate isomerase/epimerase [Oscillospiraceae bacterium]|nr:sugar phosphate isomerase/epimerase [Oscillospiraceae bacterium]